MLARLLRSRSNIKKHWVNKIPRFFSKSAAQRRGVRTPLTSPLCTLLVWPVVYMYRSHTRRTREIGPGEPPVDDEMSEMTLPSKHRTRNSNPGCLRPSTHLSIKEAPHNTEFYDWMGKKHSCFFQTAETGKRTLNSSVKAAVLITTLGPPPVWTFKCCISLNIRRSVLGLTV